MSAALYMLHVVPSIPKTYITLLFFRILNGDICFAPGTYCIISLISQAGRPMSFAFNIGAAMDGGRSILVYVLPPMLIFDI